VCGEARVAFEDVFGRLWLCHGVGLRSVWG
jgi:hypothetical protein